MYNLDVSPKITKDLLLQKNSQETYFEHYLGVPVKTGLFCSPNIIRKDNKPTCAFFKDKRGILRYKDFAGPTFDFIGAVMYIYSTSYYKALRIIANDFDIIEYDKVEKNPPKMSYTGNVIKETQKAKIQVELKDFTAKELSWWGSFGISKKTLEKFRVYSIKSVFLNGRYYNSSSDTSPIYGYYGGKDSNKDELWRIYMPTKRNYRFLSNWRSTIIQGSKQIPKDGKFIVITKSLKDVMSLYEFGIPAIAPNGENIFLTEAQYKKLSGRFDNLYLLYDRDLPGIRSAKKFKQQFPNLKVVLMPKTKDFSDYVKKYGTLRTLNLVNDWLEKECLK